jgi:type IV pilus assembly protein PilA
MTYALRNKRGVTLVELLAVIIILAIITAIAVPTIGNLIERQRRNAAEASWSSVEEAARLYAVDLEVGAVFSVADLNAGDYLSTDIILLAGTVEDPAPTEVATAKDIFVVGASGTITIDLTGLTGTKLFIGGYIVYPVV